MLSCQRPLVPAVSWVRQCRARAPRPPSGLRDTFSSPGLWSAHLTELRFFPETFLEVYTPSQGASHIP